MKPKLFLFLKTIFISLVFSGLCLAQENQMVKLPDVVATTNHAKVSPKVLDAFYHYFQDVKDINWTKLDENFFVSFMMKDQQSNALFYKNGYMLYHVSHGYERHLPAQIRKRIKTHPDYFDYNITHVIYINQEDRNVWVAYLEDNKNVILIRIEDDMLEEVERFNKSL
ncbi:hypothetical protein OCK74_15360 [Chitinophagaceae bacterium LB-8]|uniref:Beta-lactamase-inhibitor-like PepSY-like domain-containing protein n=1 Tax=Paraflavisolibacter caeni TaxID=2982496 RepID=A0A9X2XX22_9BACT|nr:hypothetical protein [Paraflavisolibacter caeni]MCU7550495.1 hypothetical protein [Paraflavisolibacter caeni]